MCQLMRIISFALTVDRSFNLKQEDRMDELLKELACFGCPYADGCEDEWEDGYSHCNEMLEKAKNFAKRKGIKMQN